MRYRKKPVEIDAIQWLGGEGDATDALCQWCGGRYRSVGKPSDPTDVAEWIEIPTLEGVMRASVGDWIVRGIRGEFYPVKDSIFCDTYEEVPNA